MRVTILCSDITHPINHHIRSWKKRNQDKYEITLAQNATELQGGDILFLVSCHEIIRAIERSAYGATLVLHASDLPLGRGWSPHIWDILNGSEKITLSLIEADDGLDSGRIWHQSIIQIPKHVLWNEINQLLFSAELKVIDFVLTNFDKIVPHDQSPDITPS